MLRSITCNIYLNLSILFRPDRLNKARKEEEKVRQRKKEEKKRRHLEEKQNKSASAQLEDQSN